MRILGHDYQIHLPALIGSARIGVSVGGLVALFIVSLNFVIRNAQILPWIFWLLPVAGYLIGWSYQRWGGSTDLGMHLILTEVHEPKKPIPIVMLPVIFFSTLVTHAVGGSAGREGVALQLGAGLADQWSRQHGFAPASRFRFRFLIAGLAAGFSAAIGTPIAAVFFAFEVLRRRFFNLNEVVEGALEAILASVLSFYSAHLVIHWLGEGHLHFPTVAIPRLEGASYVHLLFCAGVFGLIARFSIAFMEYVKHTYERVFKNLAWRGFAGGVILSLAFLREDSHVYARLGLERLQSSFEAPVAWYEPLLKLVYTVLTVGAGFKGGEFTPLVLIGAQSGGYLSSMVHLPLPMMAALGFSAVFGAASNTPFACAMMAGELFGWALLPYALVVNLFAQWISGTATIYRGQR